MLKLNQSMRVAGTLGITSILVIAASQSKAGGWDVAKIDTAGTGRYSSLKFDPSGNAHVAYVTEDEHLKYAFWDHTINRWFTMVVAPKASFCSLAVDSHQQPQISYIAQSTGASSQIRYAHWDGQSWHDTVIPIRDGAAYYTSITLDQNDFPTVVFFDNSSRDGVATRSLKVLHWNGTYWALRTLDSQAVTGPINAITTDPGGGDHLAYTGIGEGNSGLRYAYSSGSAWKTEAVEDGQPSHNISWVAIAVDRNNRPHITYVDAVQRLIKYAFRTGERWQVQVVARLGDSLAGDRGAIAVDEQARPFISFYDARLGILSVASLTGTNWTVETVDKNFSGFSSSLQIDHGTLWVTYGAEDGSLKAASKQLPAPRIGSNSAAPKPTQSPKVWENFRRQYGWW